VVTTILNSATSFFGMGVTQHDRVVGTAAVRSADAVQRVAVAGDNPTGVTELAGTMAAPPRVVRSSHKLRALVLLGLLAWIPIVLILALVV
jgi:hypothetical protein